MSKGIVWVCGASSGIGLAAARELAAGGWRLGLGARGAGELEAIAAGLPRADAGSHASAAVDVRDARGVADWAHALRDRMGGEPDVLVYAAGWGVFESVAAMSEETWDATMDTNAKGLFLVTKAVLPAMLARGRGHIVSVLSVAARAAFPKNGAYNASKFAALGFTEALRAEVRRHGVRVTAVLPGATDTPFWDRLGGDWDRSRMMPPSTVARAIRQAIETPADGLVEEIRIAPPLGNL